MSDNNSIGYLLQKSMPLENRMGIYFGINQQYKEVVYVGKSKDYWKRIPNSLEEKIKSKQNENCKDYGCELISFIPCNTVEEMAKLEIDRIIYWKPYYNQQHNSDYYMNNDNKRLREILRKACGRNLLTYEILFSIMILDHKKAIINRFLECVRSNPGRALSVRMSCTSF